MGEDPESLSDQENTYSSHCLTERRYLCGENSETGLAKLEFAVPFSAMNRKRSALTLSERLTPLLISVGLVRGTTLTYGLRLLGRGIRVGASFAPDGSVVDIQLQVCTFWKGHSQEV